MNQIYEIGAVNAKMTGEEKGVKQRIVLTQEDIDANPELEEAGIQAGDEIEEEAIVEAPKEEVVKKPKK